MDSVVFITYLQEVKNKEVGRMMVISERLFVTSTPKKMKWDVSV